MLYWIADVCRSFCAVFAPMTHDTLVVRLLPVLRQYSSTTALISQLPTNATTVHSRQRCDYLVLFGPDNEPLYKFLIPSRAGSRQAIIDRLSTCKAMLTIVERCSYSFGYYTEEYGRLVCYYTSRRHRLAIGDHALIDRCPLCHSIKLCVSREMRCTYHVDSLQEPIVDFCAFSDYTFSLFRHARFSDKRKPLAVEQVLGDNRRVKVRFG